MRLTLVAALTAALLASVPAAPASAERLTLHARPQGDTLKIELRPSNTTGLDEGHSDVDLLDSIWHQVRRAWHAVTGWIGVAADKVTPPTR